MNDNHFFTSVLTQYYLNYNLDFVTKVHFPFLCSNVVFSSQGLMNEFFFVCVRVAWKNKAIVTCISTEN